MGRAVVARNTVYLYGEQLISMLLGYAFWFILSKITTPEVIGITSSLTSLAAIFATIASIGMPIGVQRLLGNMYFESKFADIKVIVNASIIITFIGLVGSCLFLFMARDLLFGFIDSRLLAVSLLLISSICISTLFRYILIASLKTKKLFIFSMASSLVRIILTIILIFEGADALGVMIGYTSATILVSSLLAFTIKEFFKQYSTKPISDFNTYFRKLMSISMVNWIPLLVNTIGSQLGTIIVFGFQGAGHAAFYFISLQIYTAVAAVIWSLESTTYPRLSSIHNDERKKFAIRLIKISLIITLPFSYCVIFYSQDIMQLFGDRYSQGSLSLQILMMSIFPVTVLAGITTFLYSHGKYRTILGIELVTSVPRSVLYFVLVPIYGITLSLIHI